MKKLLSIFLLISTLLASTSFIACYSSGENTADNADKEITYTGENIANNADKEITYTAEKITKNNYTEYLSINKSFSDLTVNFVKDLGPGGRIYDATMIVNITTSKQLCWDETSKHIADYYFDGVVIKYKIESVAWRSFLTDGVEKYYFTAHLDYNGNSLASCCVSTDGLLLTLISDASVKEDLVVTIESIEGYVLIPNID